MVLAAKLLDASYLNFRAYIRHERDPACRQPIQIVQNIDRMLPALLATKRYLLKMVIGKQLTESWSKLRCNEKRSETKCHSLSALQSPV